MNNSESELPLFTAIFTYAFDAIVIANEQHRIKYWNQSATRLFGFEADAVIGENLWKLISPPAAADIQSEWAAYQMNANESSSSLGRVVDVEAVRGNGHLFWVAMTLTSVSRDGAPWTVAIIRDMTSTRKRENRLRQAASTDSLSGLSNRGEFQKRLESNFSESLSLAILDIDNFKQINDGSGHLQGDEVVMAFGRRLRETFQDAVCVARFGGDEFGIITLLPFEEFSNQLESLRAEVSATGLAGSPATFSAGVGTVTGPASTPRTLLKQADELLYLSKSEGRNRVSVPADRAQT